MSKQHLFFLAILPPDVIRREVTAFKEAAAELFHSSRALNAPPHITLIPPFRWPADQIPALSRAIQRFSKSRTPFLQELKGFDVFAPRVIFVDVVLNDHLKALQKEVEHFLEREIQLSYDRPKRPYHPHMTIAYKDLRKEVFPAAWAHFSRISYERMFSVDALYLLRHHHRWQVFEKYSF